MASKYAYLKANSKALYRKDGVLHIDSGGISWVKKDGSWFQRSKPYGKTEYTYSPASPYVRRELERHAKLLENQLIDYDAQKAPAASTVVF